MRDFFFALQLAYMTCITQIRYICSYMVSIEVFNITIKCLISPEMCRSIRLMRCNKECFPYAFRNDNLNTFHFHFVDCKPCTFK